MKPFYFLSLMSLLFVIASEAANFQFDLNGQDLSNRRVSFQQLMNQFYPGVRLRPTVLQQVVIYAKGLDNSASADLIIDGYSVDRRAVPGVYNDYYNNDPRSFLNVNLSNLGARRPARDCEIGFNGTIRVQTIIVSTVDFAPPPPPPLPPPPIYNPGQLVMVDIGMERTQKLVSTMKTFRPVSWDDRVNRVVITGTVEKVLIQQVVVIFADGHSQVLPELAQKINVGQQVGAFLPNMPIREIQVTSLSGNFAGSRGEYKISLGVIR